MRPNYRPQPFNTLIVIVALLVLGGHAYSANWYVRPSSAGSNTGVDWNNAWSMSSIEWGSVGPGDTVWLAGGTYSSALTVSASGTASSPITVLRATSVDSAATSSAGWSSSFDSQVVIRGQAPGIDIPSNSYITIDGHQNAGSLIKNGRVYGIKVVTPSDGGSAVEAGEAAAVTGLTFKNIDLLGPYNTPSHPSSYAANGFNLAPYNHARTNLLFHDCRVAGYAESFRENMWTNVVVEYCYIADEANDGPSHEDVDFIYPPSQNCIWRYNIITNSPNDGFTVGYGGMINWYFYGNIYWNSDAELFQLYAGYTYGPYHIYNNIFASTGAAYGAGWITNKGTAAPGCQVFNNIFINTQNTIGGSSDYNAYNYTNLEGVIPKEPHMVIFSGNSVFVNPAAGDFHLTPEGSALFAHGTPLATDGFINRDIDGNTRGTGGIWYIGAYQYSGGSQLPAPPTDLRITSGH